MKSRGEFKLRKRNILKAGSLGVECATDFPSGRVTMSMQNAASAVRSLTSECKPGTAAIELSAPVDQLLNALRTLFHENAGCFRMDNAVARGDCVLKMKTDLIFIAQSDGDPALSIL